MRSRAEAANVMTFRLVHYRRSLCVCVCVGFAGVEAVDVETFPGAARRASPSFGWRCTGCAQPTPTSGK
eukprot:3422936-Pyramimonas_sp.AAC.1